MPLEVVVGRIGRAHGVRGEVSIEVRTDSPDERFAPGTSLRSDPVRPVPLTVESLRWQSGRLLLTFEGVADRTAAQALANTLLLVAVDPDERPEDPEEFFDHQLIDLVVVTSDGTCVGRIESMLHPPGQDLISVRRVDGSELLVPFVAEIVPSIDLEARLVVIDAPPGLLEAESD